MMACVSIVAAVYSVCCLYLDKVSTESLHNWLQSEQIEIQEGNLLNAITKNQRVLTASEFIKGVSLVDISLRKQNELISFGQPIETELIVDSVRNGIKKINHGFFSRVAISSIPGQSNLAIAFYIDGGFIRIIFLVASLGLIVTFILSSSIIFTLQLRISKKREELLIAEAKEKAAFSELAARVAHDIRSPMAVLSKVINAPLGEQETRKIIANAASRLQGITDELVGYWQQGVVQENASIESSSIQSCHNFSLNEVIQDLIEEKYKFYQNLKEIKFNFVVNRNDSKLVLNKVEFFRHLSNLTDNAVEAIGTAGNVSFEVIDEDNVVKVSISDDGAGISKDALAKIGRTKISIGKTRGSGQGVYYARQFVKSMGGELTIESTVGIGSSFTFLFPKSKNILIVPKVKCLTFVDDDILGHELWLEFLRKNSVAESSSMIFKTAHSYLSWSENAPDHVVFSDYQLNDKNFDGLSLLARAYHAKSTYLATNSCVDAVEESCKAQGIRLLTKYKLDELKIVWC